MRKVVLDVAEKRPEGVSVADFKAAQKLGPLVDINYATAIQNVKLGKGLYSIRPEKVEPVAPGFGSVPVAEMTRSQLFGAAITFGVTIQKPKMPTDQLRSMVQKRYDEFMAGDPDPDEDPE